MKRSVSLSTTLLCAIVCTGESFAADIPSYDEPAPISAPSAAARSWTGLYFGASAGYSWFNPEFGFTDLEADFDADSVEYDLNSFTVRGTVGYDLQINRVVVGALADVSWSSGEDDQNIVITPTVGDPGAFPTSVESGWGADILARAGFLATDQLLVYGLAGWTWKNVDFSYTDTSAVDNPTISEEETVGGWTLGVGAEAMVTDMISVKGEYRYNNLDDIEIDASGSTIDPAVGELDGSEQEILLGVNIRFNGLFQ